MKIFDSLIHSESKTHAQFNKIIKDMHDNNIFKACAVELPENNCSRDFYHSVSHYECLYPVGAIRMSENDINEVEELYNIGYRAVKIHPRYIDNFSKEMLRKVLDECDKYQMRVFYCTYSDCSIVENSIPSALEIIKNVFVDYPQLKVILLHGGTVELLKYSEFVRFNKNFLLDLSFTLCKYEGSSIDLDIKYLFEKFDRRICIGSDYPDFDSKKLRDRFNIFSSEISQVKKENIAYKNLEAFLYE